MKRVVLLAFLIITAHCSAPQQAEDPESASKKAAVTAEKKQARAGDAKKEKLNQELQQVAEEAWPVFDNILLAMNENDYERFIRDFDATMRAAYQDKNIFVKNNAARIAVYGKNTGRSVHKITKRAPYYLLHYWVRFAKTEKPVTFLMNLVKKEGTLKVAFLQFKFSELGKSSKP